MAPKLKSIKSIQTYLATQDKQLARALKNAPLYPVAKEPAHNSHFETIVFAVIGQQLSGKAADTITHRLIKKTGSPVKPRKVIKLGHDELRAVGLSNAKARTILELSQAVVDGFDLDKEIPLWSVEAGGKAIARVFAFTNFKQAFDFMTLCARYAEKIDHHPDWSNSWNKVSVKLTTHSATTLTTLDIQLAKAMDAFASQVKRD